MRFAVLFLLLFVSGSFAHDESRLRSQMREASWTVYVRNANGEDAARGSCTVTVDAKGRTWAVGCYHVIADVVGGGGHRASIVRPVYENGELVGRTEWLAEVVKCSESEDLALMRVAKSGIGSRVKFDLSGKAIPVDGELWHCGTFLGVYDQRVSKGLVTGYGYKLKESMLPCDCTDLLIHPGSSGGGVFNANGEVVGVVSWMHGSGNGFFVPSRRLVPWLKSVGYGFVADPSLEDREVLPKPKVRKK